MKKIGSTRYFAYIILFVVFVTKAFSQESSLSNEVPLYGTVTDHIHRFPLAGVTLQINGASSKIRTDKQGNFKFLTAYKLPYTLILSAVGYETQTVTVSTSPVQISLIPSTEAVDEVVVVGYGTQRRKDVTGAIASVSKKHLEYNVSPSVDVLLGGAVAGVNVTQSSGQPGAPATIRIRGGNSVNASNNPLYVIDGFIFFSDNSSTKVGFGGIEGELNPLSLLNPADIATIDVLKDVSATAIYGSRGSNGVIVITTKKGENGKSRVDYQYALGAANSAKRLDLLNATQWARLQKDFFLNKPGYSEEEISQLGNGYDWQDAVLRTGITQNHSLSIHGGDEKSQYFISGNQLDQEGVVLNSGFKRFVGRVNYQRDVFSDLKVGVQITGSKSTQSSLSTFEAVSYNSSPYSAGIANSLTYALYMPPVVPFYNADGGYNYSNPFEYSYLREGSKTANPISDLENSTAQSLYTALLGNVYAAYSPFAGFTARVSLGGNVGHATQNYFSPSYTALGLEPQGVGGVGNKRSEILLSEYTLSYAKRLDDSHSFDVLGGYTNQKSKNNFLTTLSSRFTNEDLGVGNLQDGKPYGSRPIFSGLTSSELHSLLGRVNYSFKERYHLTANIRSDYSTRFAKNHKWGTFPSIGLAWNIAEESFLKGTSKLNALKLRASTGSVGNQEIGDYEYLQLLEAVYYGGNVAYRVGNTGNEDLRWETTTQHNIGLDAGFYNNRLTISADVYSKKTSDLLLRIPPTLGQENEQLINVGNLENQGAELSIHAIAIEKPGFQWTIAANAAHNRNRITELFNNVQEVTKGVEILQVGKSLGSFYGQVFEGVVQQGDDISSLPLTPSYAVTQPGDPKLKDVNNDNHITVADREILGSRQPRFTYGLSSSINFRGFDFFVLAQGVQGNHVYNQLRRYLERPTDAYNVSAALLDSWTTTNPSTTTPRISTTPFSSELDSRYIEDASFLRIRTITLGYTVAGSLFKTSRLQGSKLRVYATAQNPFTFTKYKGYDPEVGSGIDLGTYPMPKVLMTGVSLSF